MDLTNIRLSHLLKRKNKIKKLSFEFDTTQKLYNLLKKLNTAA
jgi:hypothetical protein